MKICEIDLNHFHKCVSVDICCLTCWLTHRLTRASTKSTGNVCFWMDHGDVRWHEYSFMAWHEIIICFLYTCTCWFYFLMLFKKKKKKICFRYNDYINLKRLIWLFIKTASNECACVWMFVDESATGLLKQLLSLLIHLSIIFLINWSVVWSVKCGDKLGTNIDQCFRNPYIFSLLSKRSKETRKYSLF